MNLLNVTLDWHSVRSDPAAQDENFSLGPVSLQVRRIKLGSGSEKNFVYNREQGVLCGFTGYLSNAADLRKKFGTTGDEDDCALVAELYLKDGEASFPLLEGLFTMFIWDFTRKKGYLFQDEHGSQTPLLYVGTPEKMFFSNSLKVLLRDSALPRKLNLQAARDFLCNKVVVPNESTLVGGVRKLLPGHVIAIDALSKSMEIRTLRREETKTPPDRAKKTLVASIGEEIERLSGLTGDAAVATALSSGFDSNLMLFFLNKQPFKKITAVTIGGRQVNEIPAASRCAAAYGKVRHLPAVVPDARLQDFPEIVWRTEGHVFETGLFLTHEFAKLLKKEGIPAVFLGDCADQQLNPFRLKKKGPVKRALERIKYRLKQRIVPLRRLWRVFKRKKTYVSKYPPAFDELRKPEQVYDTKKDYVLKKGGVFFNSYGIQPLYPFLGRKTAGLTRSLKPRECRRKNFYRAAVRETLGPEISRHLKKIGGTVDIEFLCKGREPLFEKLLRTDLIRAILPRLDEKQKKEMLAEVPFYTEFLLHLLYIYLFNELFITGKYDRSLQDAGIGVALEDFFNASGNDLR